MLRHAAVWPLVVLLLAPLGCTKVPEGGSPVQGNEFTAESLPSSDEIPAAWGRLVSVTSEEANRYRLWFSNDAGEIRIVVVSTISNRIGSHARLIRRK